MCPRTYNLQAGLLMTILVGAAFVIHRDQEALYLAGGSASSTAAEHQSGRSGGYTETAGNSASGAGAGSNSAEGKISSSLSAHATPHLPQ